MASSRRTPGAHQRGCCGPGRAPRLCVDAGSALESRRAAARHAGGPPVETVQARPSRDWETLGQGKTEHTQR